MVRSNVHFLNCLVNVARNETNVFIYRCTVACSVEDGKTVLHADVNCPGRHGEITQYASLSDLDTGTVEKCPYCKLGVEDMGKVASASTSIEKWF